MACNIIIDRKYSGITFLEIKDNNLEVYNQTENEIYFEGLESSELLKIEAIIIP